MKERRNCVLDLPAPRGSRRELGASRQLPSRKTSSMKLGRTSHAAFPSDLDKSTVEEKATFVLQYQ